MSLLDGPSIPVENLQLRLKAQTQAQIRQLFTQMTVVFTTCFNNIWENPDGLTPQQAIDAFGTDGVELFRLAWILQEAANEAKAGTLTQTPPVEVTKNQDGTVTIGS